MRRLFFILSAALVWTSCQTGVPSASSTPTTPARLYVLKCSKCHELYEPSEYNDADWSYWMEKMRKKAKLPPDQFESISDYAQTLRQPAVR